MLRGMLKPVNGTGGGTLVIHRGALGDLLGALPALHALRHAAAGAPLHFLGPRAHGTFLTRCGIVDSAWDVDEARWLPLFAAGGDVDAVRPLVVPIARAVAWAHDPDRTLAKNLRALGAADVLVAPPFGPPGDGAHAEYLSATLQPIGIAVPDSQPRVFPHADDLHGAAARIGRMTDGATPVLTVHPGSGSPRKNWGDDAFRAVLTHVRAQTPIAVIVCRGPAEDERGWRDRDWRAVADECVSDPSLAELAAVFRHSDVYLGNDSGPTHLAAAVGTSTIALFGAASDPAVWAPRGEHVRVLDATCGDETEPSAPEIARVRDAVLAALHMPAFAGRTV